VFSGGRIGLGIGLGGSTEEFRSLHGELQKPNRGKMMDEYIQALRVLWTERKATFTGQYTSFENVETYPKPVQQPLPIYSSGNAEGSIRRAAQLCEGWLPAGMGPAKIAAGRDRLRAYAQAAGRDPDAIEIAPQLVVCIGRTVEQAEKVFKGSQAYEHLVSLQQSTLKGFDIPSYVSMNLIGSVDEVVERVGAYHEAGADHFPGLLFVANNVDEMIDQFALFAETVIPHFARETTVA
jgi:alkanesulfonate monooxygenase SsuD/methylene tetrahydromethanopterin reductase-like flavin-dependent oxidoreductase (luciferase family)